MTQKMRAELHPYRLCSLEEQCPEVDRDKRVWRGSSQRGASFEFALYKRDIGDFSKGQRDEGEVRSKETQHLSHNQKMS
jgi:hypothetical protein